MVVHPTLLKNLLDAFKTLHVPEHEAKKRIILATWHETFDNLPSGYTHTSDLLTTGRLDREANFDGRYAHDTALMCYSSGTTGLAKGVEVRIQRRSIGRLTTKGHPQTTHKNLVSIMCMFPSVFVDMKPGEDKMLGFLPAYHIYGCVDIYKLELY